MKALIARVEYWPIYEIRDVDYKHGLGYSGNPVCVDIGSNIIEEYQSNNAKV